MKAKNFSPELKEAISEDKERIYSHTYKNFDEFAKELDKERNYGSKQE